MCLPDVVFFLPWNRCHTKERKNGQEALLTTGTNILTGVAICISAQLENVVCCGNTASSLVRNACLCWRAQEDTPLTHEIPLQSRHSPWGLSCPVMVLVNSHQLPLGLCDWDPY